MDGWTFGIITDGYNNTRVLDIIDSIHKLKIPDDQYQILVVGPTNVVSWNTTVLYFDDTIKPAWITRKKNLIAERAKFDNVVLLHDYIVFEENWYKGFQEFGNDWDVCMNPIINFDGTRFRDWVWLESLEKGPPRWIPYSDGSQTRQMYVSGSYFVVKRQFMLDNPLDESRGWGDGEDVEWSFRVREKWNYKLNTLSKVKLLKQKITHCI